MGNSNSKNSFNNNNPENSVEVLYQKLGEKWYAFSVVEDEVYLGSLPRDLAENYSTSAPEIEIEN